MTYELVARSGRPSVWVFELAPASGQVKELGRGVDIDTLVADGDVDRLPFVPTFAVEQGSRWGDLLWTGDRTKIASERLLGALASFRGWRSFNVRLLDRNGATVPGYRGLATVTGVADPDVQRRWVPA